VGAIVPIKYQGLGTKYTHRARRLLASGSPVLFAGGIALAGLAISSLTKGTTLNPLTVWALLLAWTILLVFQMVAEYRKRTRMTRVPPRRAMTRARRHLERQAALDAGGDVGILRDVRQREPMSLPGCWRCAIAPGFAMLVKSKTRFTH
jgi:hypothetical protein